MTEPDYVWLTNDRIDPPPVIKVVAGSEWHYTAGGWVATDPVPELTAADIEAQNQPEDVKQPELETPEEAPEAEAAEEEPEPQSQESE